MLLRFKNSAAKVEQRNESELTRTLSSNRRAIAGYAMAVAQPNRNFFFTGLLVAALVALYFANIYNYLLFHTLVELFSVIVAVGIFMIAWNVRGLLNSDYLLFLGVAYFFVGMLDLAHMLTYKGMQLLPRDGANTATQLWVAARYLESLSLLISPWLLWRRIGSGVYLAGYSAVSVLILVSIFYWQNFPDCFPSEGGLTSFKKISEYVICVILIAAAFLLYRRRDYLDRAVVRWLLIAIGLTIISELTFTTYGQAYSLSNLIGHYFKVLSYFFIYKAIIETGLTRPYSLLFHELKHSEQQLQHASQELEHTVHERTRVLRATVDDLSAEIRRRMAAESMLRQLSRKSIEALESDRKAVAKELHDSVGASLAAIKFILEEVLESLSKGEASHPVNDVQKAIYYLSDTIQESKRISARLRPLTLEELGLLPTIQAYVRKFSDLYEGMQVDLKISATEDQIPEHLKIVIYRILQEGLNNIGKHSKADQVWIRLSADCQSVVFILWDNGIGFDVNQNAVAGESLQGYGLQGMRERAEIIGGCFSLTAHPGKGTRIEVVLPHHPADHTRADKCGEPLAHP